MVEKMKKYKFLVYYKTCNEFLESIRQAGVVHIVEKQKGIPDDATELRKQLATAGSLNVAINSLQPRLVEQSNGVPDTSLDTIKGALEVFEQLKLQEERLNSQKIALQNEVRNMTVWGDFDPEISEKLEETTGLQLKFYLCRERDFNAEWKDTFNAVEVARIGTMIYFVTFTPVDSEDEPNAEKARISERSISQLQEALQKNQEMTEELEKQYVGLAAEHLANMKEAQSQLNNTIDLNKVYLQSEKEAGESLIMLEGWVPEVKEPDLLRVLETQDVCFLSEAPDKDDNTAPVLLKNNKFAKLFEPIGKMYNLPNYHEIDPTPFFAPFYLLFFGICLGDAGYGLLVLVATLIARNKLQPSLKPIMTLASILGASAVVCGIITGSLFGIQLLEVQWAWLEAYKRYMIDADNMFNVALMLGVVQIIFGMFIRAFGAVRRYGWAYSLERWGWLILIIGCGSWYLASEKEMLSPEVGKYVLYAVLGISGLFILVLNTPGRNPLINIGSGLYASFNMITGLFGDVLSYIRLFALCLCGSVMGLVFNDLAMQINAQAPIIVGQLLMLFILLLGHSINIFMSSIGAFVHPLRLTFVEFYKNIGYEGGGREYKPFSTELKS